MTIMLIVRFQLLDIQVINNYGYSVYVEEGSHKAYREFVNI